MRCKNVALVLCVVLLVLDGAQSASAQTDSTVVSPPRRTRPIGTKPTVRDEQRLLVNLMSLLHSRKVCKELSLDDEAIRKFQEARKELSDEQRATLKASGLESDFPVNLQGLSQSEREQRQTQFREYSKIVSEYRNLEANLFRATFSDEQQKRLKQIHWQKMGGSVALTDAEFLAALDVTNEQHQRLAAIIQDHRQKANALLYDGQFNIQDDDKIAQIRKLHDDFGRKAKEIFTPDQQQEFDNLLGEKFEFERP